MNIHKCNYVRRLLTNNYNAVRKYYVFKHCFEKQTHLRNYQRFFTRKRAEICLMLIYEYTRAVRYVIGL